MTLAFELNATAAIAKHAGAKTVANLNVKPKFSCP
jgi:hypothetical protein